MTPVNSSTSTPRIASFNNSIIRSFVGLTRSPSVRNYISKISRGLWQMIVYLLLFFKVDTFSFIKIKCRSFMQWLWGKTTTVVRSPSVTTMQLEATTPPSHSKSLKRSKLSIRSVTGTTNSKWFLIQICLSYFERRKSSVCLPCR